MTKIMKGGVAYNSTSNIVALTQAEYNALSTAQKNNGNFYCITDADPSYFSAENIDYDNTDSGLSATNVQNAIDEVADVKGEVTQIHKTDDATYSLLLATDNTTTTDTGNVYKSSFLKYNPSTQILNLSSYDTPTINSVEINPRTGGKIFVRNITTTHPSYASLTADAGGGHVNATTPSGRACVSMNGTSTGGVVTVTDHNRTENIVLTGSTGDITCAGVNGIYWSSSKDTYSNTSVTFTTSNTISSGHFIWIIGDANQQPIFSILAIHTTIRTGNIKNLGYAISVGVSDNSITITAPAWSSIRLVSDLRWV